MLTDSPDPSRPSDSSRSESARRRAAYLKEYRKFYRSYRKVFAMALPQDSWDVLVAVAETAGVKPPTYARRVLLEHLGLASASPPPPHPELGRRLDEANRLLRAVSNNINQIAHHLHVQALQTRAPDPAAVQAQVRGLFDGLDLLRREVARIADTPYPPSP
jgi:hypothetical protein